MQDNQDNLRDGIPNPKGKVESNRIQSNYMGVSQTLHMDGSAVIHICMDVLVWAGVVELMWAPVPDPYLTY